MTKHDRTLILAVRLDAEEMIKARKLGGSRWVRAQIEQAELPRKPTWNSLEERNQLLLADLRPTKIAARDYGLAPETVSNIKSRAKAKLKGPSCPLSPPPSSSET